VSGKSFYVLLGLVLLVSGILRATNNPVEIRSPFKALKKVTPEYPEKLKKEGIEGEIVLLVSTKRNGHVGLVQVMKSLHPELDKLAVEAFQKWEFEPYIHDGEAIPAMVFISIFYNAGDTEEPEKQTTGVEPVVPLEYGLQTVLDQCDEYCRKLSVSAFSYVCHEKINEINKHVIEQERWMIRSDPRNLNENEVMIAKHREPELEKREKNRFIYDYQLINKDGEIKEQRILLELNGKKTNETNAPLESTKRLYSLKPIFLPIWLLAREQQPLFSYKIAKNEKIMGKNTCLIEISPKRKERRGFNWGKVWVDKMNLQIIKAEVETGYTSGYEDVIEECSRYHLKPHFLATHYYQIEKDGVLFPSRSEIRVEYEGLSESQRALKTKTDIDYLGYRFFSVGTESKVLGPKK
jgi:protein TonB